MGSSSSVYGSRTDGPFNEEMIINKPISPYAATKAGGDLLCRAYFKTFGVPVVVTHCSNN